VAPTSTRWCGRPTVRPIPSEDGKHRPGGTPSTVVPRHYALPICLDDRSRMWPSRRMWHGIVREHCLGSATRGPVRGARHTGRLVLAQGRPAFGLEVVWLSRIAAGVSCVRVVRVRIRAQPGDQRGVS
jgi:hypothetical protein